MDASPGKITLLLPLLLLASCSTVPTQQTPVVEVIDRSSGPVPEAETRVEPATDPLVVAGLQQQAAELNRSGNPARAASLLERALRVQPRNPQLWHDLARVRYDQQSYQQAESLALRSNQFASRQPQLLYANWRLIADAREKMGNSSGAVSARKQAERYAGR